MKSHDQIILGLRVILYSISKSQHKRGLSGCCSIWINITSKFMLLNSFLLFRRLNFSRSHVLALLCHGCPKERSFFTLALFLSFKVSEADKKVFSSPLFCFFPFFDLWSLERQRYAIMLGIFFKINKLSSVLKLLAFPD